MALTDREIIKERQAGQAQSYGLSNGTTAPKAAIAAMHQEVIDFDIISDASLAETGIRCERAFRVISAYFTPATALAANGSSYITQVVGKRDGAGGAAVTCASLDTNTAGQNVSLAQFVPGLFTLTATAADLVFAIGNVMTFKSTETGTPATPIGKVAVLVEYI